MGMLLHDSGLNGGTGRFSCLMKSGFSCFIGILGRQGDFTCRVGMPELLMGKDGVSDAGGGVGSVMDGGAIAGTVE